jgi:nucleoside-diphosphate-sugar epimerase
VRILDNLATGKRENIEAIRSAGADRLEWIEGDIRDVETCRRACREIDFVLHQAALGSVQRSIQNPEETTAVNVQGTVNVLEAARREGVRKVVSASSSSVYGNTETLPKHEELTPNPLTPYAAGKLAGEQFSRVFAHTMGLPTVSLRYFNVFGPRQGARSQYAAVVPQFIRALLDGQRPTVYGDGGQSRDFTFVDNVVEANLAACAPGNQAEGVINIACGARYSLTQLLETLGRLLGVQPNPEFLPSRPGDVRHSQASIERAARLLSFQPSVGFEAGLARTIDFHRRGS